MSPRVGQKKKLVLRFAPVFVVAAVDVAAGTCLLSTTTLANFTLSLAVVSRFYEHSTN